MLYIYLQWLMLDFSPVHASRRMFRLYAERNYCSRIYLRLLTWADMRPAATSLLPAKCRARLDGSHALLKAESNFIKA